MNGDDGPALITRLVRSGRIVPDELALELDATALAEHLLVPAHRMESEATLLRNVAIGRSWFGEIKAGATIDALAKREGLSRACILQLVELAFLSPALV